MPKGGGKRSNKGHSGRSGAGRSRQENTSDDESVADNASIVSIASSSQPEEVAAEEVDEQSQEEAFEEKLLECVDALSEKSAQARTNALEQMSKALSSHYLPDFVLDRYVTISEAVRLSLRRGRGPEQAAAAHLAPLLCVALGASQQAEEVAAALAPSLQQLAADASANLPARAKCCWSLAVLSFLTEMEPAAAASVERLLFETWSRTNVASGPEAAALVAAALSGWTLLLTVAGHNDNQADVGRLAALLASPHLEVRTAAGEALAVMHEANPIEEQLDEVIELLSELATDGSRFRGKKERKAQRSSFREIVAFMEEGRNPELRVRFGTEALEVASWAGRKHYEAFCQILGPGLNRHLALNDLPRQVFELGAPITPSAVPVQRATKLERHLMNAATFKARTLSRAKHRDKRSDVG